jgi:eukaryotic-like serine/threonine-protein kinase
MHVPAASEPTRDDESEGLSLRLPYQLGRYTLCRELGAGGMATVFFGRMKMAEGFDRLVAVKTIHSHLARAQTFVDMFLDEAKIASQINHPNVCSVYDFGNIGGTYYLALEYLIGEPLFDFVNRVVDSRNEELMGALPYLAARIMADACEGLHAAHETRGPDGSKLDVVHRDVSPQNLFITYDGAVKVVDFGCAKAVARVTQTDTGIMKGKVSYAAPEQLRVGNLDARADVWALGVCLWEALSLRQLFSRETAIQTAMAVLEGPIPRADEGAAWVPKELADITEKALQRDPEARYKSARAMGRDLRAFIARSGASFEAAELAEWMGYLFAERKQTVLDMVAQVEQEGRSDRRSRTSAPSSTASSPGGLGDAPTKLARVASSGREKVPVTGDAWAEEGPAAREASRSRALRLDPELDDEPIELPTRRRTGMWAVIGILLIGSVTAGSLYAFGDRLGLGPRPRPARIEPTPPPEVEAPTIEVVREELPAVPDTTAPPTVAPTTAPGTAPATAPAVPGSRTRPGTQTASRTPTAPTQVQTPTPTPTGPTTSLDTSQGQVVIQVEGGWAMVFHGDRPLGRTPVRVMLPVGSQRLRLLPYGREPAQFSVVPVEWGTVNRVTLRVGPEPEPEPEPEPSAPPEPAPDESPPAEAEP